jgi:ABC-type glycerol-3-phosphate transport system substrate-binding protein
MQDHSRLQSRRRFLGMTVVGAFGGVILVACGQAAPASPTAAPQAAAPAAAPTATSSAAQPAAAQATATTAVQPTTAPAAASTGGASVKGQEAVLWGLKYDPHVERYNMLNAAFTKVSGATLKIQPQDWPLETKVLASMAAGTTPDLVCMMGKVLLPLYLRKAITSVSDLFKGWNLDPKAKFTGDSIDAYTYGSQIWGVPVEVNNVGDIVAVPADEIKQAGLNAPPYNGKDFFASYDELWQTAKTLQDKLGKDNSGKVARWGLASQGWDAQSLIGIIRSQGVMWWDSGSQKFNFNSPAGIAAFKTFVETPVKMGIETQLNQTHMDAALAGKVFLARGNMSIPGEARKVQRHYELAMVPPVGGAESDTNPQFIGEGGWGFVIPRGVKKMDVAVEFLKFAADTPAQTIWAGIYGGIISSWRELNNPDNPRWGDPKSDYVVAGMIRRAKYIDRTVYYGDGFGYISDIENHVASTCSDCRSGKLTAEQAAAQMQKLAEAQFAQYQSDLKDITIQ